MAEEIPITTIVVPRGPDMPHRAVTLETPAGSPDVRLVPIHIAKVLFFRAGKAYFTCFQALVSAGLTGADQGVLPNDVGNLLWSAAGLSIGAAVWSLVNNTTTLFSALADRYPLLKA